MTHSLRKILSDINEDRPTLCRSAEKEKIRRPCFEYQVFERSEKFNFCDRNHSHVSNFVPRVKLSLQFSFHPLPPCRWKKALAWKKLTKFVYLLVSSPLLKMPRQQTTKTSKPRIIIQRNARERLKIARQSNHSFQFDSPIANYLHFVFVQADPG